MVKNKIHCIFLFYEFKLLDIQTSLIIIALKKKEI